MSQFDEIDEMIEKEQSQIVLFEELQKHEGWLTLCTIMREQVRLRRNEVLTKDSIGLDGAVEREKDIAELRGINLVMSLPTIMIEESRLNLDALLAERRDIEEAESEDKV